MCCDYPEKIKRSVYLVMIGTSTRGRSIIITVVIFWCQGIGVSNGFALPSLIREDEQREFSPILNIV